MLHFLNQLLGVLQQLEDLLLRPALLLSHLVDALGEVSVVLGQVLLHEPRLGASPAPHVVFVFGALAADGLPAGGLLPVFLVVPVVREVVGVGDGLALPNVEPGRELLGEGKVK